MKQRQYLFLIFLQIFMMLGLSVSYAQAPPIAGQSAANNQQQILNSLGYNPAKPIAPVSHQWLKSIGTDGGPTLGQPDFSDLTGGTTALNNIGGVLPCFLSTGGSAAANLAILQACKTAAVQGQTIRLPPGDFTVTAPGRVATLTGSNFNLWLADGTTFNGTFIAGIGSDVIDSGLSGVPGGSAHASGKWFRRANTAADMSPELAIDDTFANNGGSFAATVHAIKTTCNLNLAPTAGASFSATASGTVLTVTGTVTGTITVGQYLVNPDGSLPAGVAAGTIIRTGGTGTGGAGTYNLSIAATVASSEAMNTSNAVMNNFVWCNMDTINDAVVGTGEHIAHSSIVNIPAITDNYGLRAPAWGNYIQIADYTGGVGAILVGTESDIYATGDDPTNTRLNFHMGVGTIQSTTTARMGYGLVIDSDTSGSAGGSYYGTPIRIQVPFDVAGIDLSTSTAKVDSHTVGVTAPAIRLGVDRPIDFSTNAANLFQYVSADSALEYSVAASKIFKISNAGLVTTGSLSITSNTSGSAIAVTGTDTAGLNTAGGTVTYSLYQAQGQKIAFEATGAVTLGYNGSGVQFLSGSSNLVTVNGAGSLTVGNAGGSPANGGINATLVALTGNSGGSAIALTGSDSVGINTSGGTIGYSLYQAQGQKIAFEASGAVTLDYNGSGVEFLTGSSNLVTINGSGSLTVGNAVGSLPNGGISATQIRAGSIYTGSDAASAIASASTIAPVNEFQHVSGTTSVNTITVPTGITTGFGGCITIVADGLLPFTTAGNIASPAFTAVANTSYQACYTPSTSKWYIH